MSEFIELDWYNLYCESWGDDLTSDSFVHPAKVRPALSREIYKHAIEMEWLRRGDTVIDPFGGIGGFALHAILSGVNFIGVELEQRFVDLGTENIEMWNRKYGAVSNLGSAMLIQGDSRKLINVLSHYNGFDSAISSPPFSSSLASDDPTKRGGLFREEKRGNDKTLTAEYGNSDGQLGVMNDDLSDFDCAVSSPSYEDQNACNDQSYATNRSLYSDYGHSNGQIGHTSGNTFWSAARMIIEQIYLSLKPGSVSIWVTKSFVKNGKKVDFPYQWATLCQAVGFEPVEWIRSWLIEIKNEGIVQKSLFGDDDDIDLSTRIERKSFFRAMYEKKQRAKKYFESLDNGMQMNYLWQAYARLLKENIDSGDDTRPTNESMYTEAWYDAYEDDGEPYIKIDTSIDYEVVLVMRKLK